MPGRRSNRQLAVSFGERPDTLSPAIRGNKGAGLGAMVRLALPVPPGFTLSTSLARAFMQNGRLPKRLPFHLKREMEKLQKQTGLKFGDINNPLLVSVRSGAPISMPGMMDTVLNLGLTKEMLPALAKRGGEQFAEDCFERFHSMYQEVVGAEAPTDPWEQLEAAIVGVLRSWDNPRAKEYRKLHGIPEHLGTAVNIQTMVFGNLDDSSSTGVAFSHDMLNGTRGLTGEFLRRAQGEALVSGKTTPEPIQKLAELNPEIYRELEGYATRLEHTTKNMVEIEFTVESGKLYVLQYRSAKASPEATAVYAVRAVWQGLLSKKEALERFTPEQLESLRRIPTFKKDALERAVIEGRLVAKGLPVSPGAVVGEIVCDIARAEELKRAGRFPVLYRPDTSPEDIYGMIASVAIITKIGGATSHAAVVARGLRIPAIVGVTNDAELHNGETVSVDGQLGWVFKGIVPIEFSPSRKEVNILLRWAEKAKRKIDFKAVTKRESVHQILRDIYLTEAMHMEAKGTPLEQRAREAREVIYARTAEFFICYLLVAVASELYHCNIRKQFAESELSQIGTLCGVSSLEKRSDEYLESFFGRRGGDIPSFLLLLEERGPESCASFLKVAEAIFLNEKVWEERHNYGGRPWATIARTALDYLTGTMTREIFVDRVFDLEHNTGRVFDKHPMVKYRWYPKVLALELNAKKFTVSAEELHRKLRFIHLEGMENDASYSPKGDWISPETVQVWMGGVGLKLWPSATSFDEAFRNKRARSPRW